MEALSPVVRTKLAAKKWLLICIPTSEPESSFLIGDCPVLPLTIRDVSIPAIAEGHLFGPEVATYAFPLGPKLYLQLSNQSDIRDATSTEIDLVNELQINNASHELMWSVDFPKILIRIREVLKNSPITDNE